MAFRHTEETKRKLSEMRRGARNPFFGKKHTPETREKLAGVLRGMNAKRQYDLGPLTLPQLSTTQLAYIAGLIDGEGHIGSPAGRKMFSVSIANIYTPLMTWLVETMGGGYSTSKDPRAREPCHLWVIYATRNVAALLRAVRPYLIIKADRADEVLALMEQKYPPVPRGARRMMRLALTDAERAAFTPGVGIQTDGVKQFTTRHMNLTRSLAHVYDIRRYDTVRNQGWIWVRRDTGRAD